VTTRRFFDSSDFAFSLIAFRTPQPPHDLLELRIPAGECRQRMRAAPANVPALAAQIDQVLPEFIAQFGDFEVAHRNCT
jgi:hypothetical protein